VLRIGFLATLGLGLALLISGCGLSNQGGPGLTGAGNTLPAQVTYSPGQPDSPQGGDTAASVSPTLASPAPAAQAGVVPSETPAAGSPNPPTETRETPTLPPSPTAQPASQPGPTQEQQRLLDSLENYGPAPELHNEVWLNSEPLRLADLRGKVVMVDFWTFG
jgi:hypothetical protein